MDNYDAIAYACVALRKLQTDGMEITEETIKGKMLHLMDMHSEPKIYKMYEEGK